jgi:invasion protein IalB
MSLLFSRSKALGAVTSVLLAGSVAVAAGSAGAQTTPATPRAPAQPPQTQPPAQAPAQSPPSAQAPPQGPQHVDLQATQPNWTKVCGKDQAANKEVCYTTRDFGLEANQTPVLAMAVYDIKGDDNRIVRFLMPVALMLKPGFRFSVDKGQLQEGAFEICFPNGCFAEARIKGPVVDTLKKGTTVNVIVKNQIGNEVTFSLPLGGFGTAFDGPPIDPKVLEEQQRQMQEALQKKAQEMQNQVQQGGAPAAPKQ